MKDLPADGWNHPISGGTEDRIIQLVDGNGDVASGTTGYVELFVPDSMEFNAANIQIMANASLSSFDLESEYVPFYWKETETGQDLLFPYDGKNAGVAKKAGESLGFFKCESACGPVVAWIRQ